MIWDVILLALGVLLPILTEWLEAHNRRRRAYEAAIRAMDRALIDRDADHLSCAFDELRIPDGGDPRGPDDQKPPQR